MEESILISIKLLLGITEDNEDFDQIILPHINNAFATLRQLGVGPSKGFMIEDDSTTWDQYVQSKPHWSSVKTYIYQKVKLVFDPPTNASLLESLKESIEELEYRLNLEAEFYREEEIQNGE
jgi:hypothetical protein